jgi:hypothetical protein
MGMCCSATSQKKLAESIRSILNVKELCSGRGVVVSWSRARPPPTIVSLFLLYEKKTDPISSFIPGKEIVVEAKLNQPAIG